MNKKDEYIEKYRKVHSGEQNLIRKTPVADDRMISGQCAMPGYQCMRHGTPEDIKDESVRKGRALSVLDYGSGYGLQLRHTEEKHSIYTKIPGNIQCWYLYDPAIEKIKTPPTGSLFDVIVCSEVMEHIPEEAVDDVLLDQKQYLKEDGIAMFIIAGLPAFNHFEDDENLHCTVEKPEWWDNKIKKHFKRYIMKWVAHDKRGTIYNV